MNSKEITPSHDTPVGLVHPYWARKPLNIIEALISEYSNEGDLVLDPFVGSGTSIFAALTQKRRIIGSDINPLAIFIVRSILDLMDNPDEKKKILTKYIDDTTQNILPWYQYRDNLYIERERYKVDGSYEYGKFNLVLQEIIIKNFGDGRFTGRFVEKKPIPRNIDIPKNLYKYPIDFDGISLLENSRIAIPKGAFLGHYFSKKNQACLNLAINAINTGFYGEENSDLLRLLISASIPLLRLSDKKASSQWPYWRPKKELTSRNPILVFLKKEKAIIKAQNWLLENIDRSITSNITTYCNIYNLPVQELVPNIIKAESVDLIITDPPYSNQVPYLEYSSLWLNILDIKVPEDFYKYEIVESDSPQRKKDYLEFRKRFNEGIEICSRVLKRNGNFILFYQDQNIDNWALLEESIILNDLRIEKVISFNKQRRSLKTVMSPNKTLDGDLVLVIKKNNRQNIFPEMDFSEFCILLKSELSNLDESSSYFDIYSIIIQYSLKYRQMRELSKRFNKISDVVQFLKSKG